MSIRLFAAGAGLVAAVAVGATPLPPVRQPDTPSLARQDRAGSDTGDFSVFAWRHLGPFTGGDTTAIAGVASDPRVLYIGTAGGGIWHTGDYGRTWRPIFDGQSTGVIGEIVVAPSDPQVLYAGTGAVLDGLALPNGNGFYKSADGGATWTHLGLAASGRIPRIAVHPTNPDLVLVAALGDPSAPGEERGVYRSTNGGRTFSRVLFRDATIGAIDVLFDPLQPSVAYASLWQPAPLAGAAAAGSGSGVFKSSDGGVTWQAAGRGLPTSAGDGLGRTALAASAVRAGQVFASVSARTRAGFYRSDDAGTSWSLVGSDARVNGLDLEIDPAQPDVLYAAGAAALRSTDGGRTWTPWRTEARGTIYHRLWIHPKHPAVAALAGSGGAVITVNGGATWSAESGPPTAAFSQVTTDTAFPYRVCGGQPSGHIMCVGSGGPSTPFEWPAPDATRSGYVAVDPADPDLLYAGELRRYDRRTGQALPISPPGEPVSNRLAAAPLLFSPTSSRALYYAASALWTSTTGGQTWTRISPELPESASDPRGERTAISAVSVSSVDGRVIWMGTTEGRVHMTRDQGATWTDVTPPGTGPRAAVTGIQASHFDTSTGYAVLTGGGAGTSRVLRTRSAGASWTDITGLLAPGRVHVVREDTGRRGLLFAAGDRSVSLSFDDGDSWQSLRLNLPPAPVRDLVVKESDVIVATIGRGLWLLDDISALRQVTADVRRARAFLFRPPSAWRTREAPPAVLAEAARGAAERRAEGVALSYALGEQLDNPLAVEIVDGPAGEVVRRYSTETPGQLPPVTRGLHRVQWDLRHTPPAVDWLGEEAALEPPRGRLVLPGTYQVRLTSGQINLRQAFLVRMDPRVKVSAMDLVAQTKLTSGVEAALAQLASRYRSVRAGQTLLPASPVRGASGQVIEALQHAGRELVRMFVVLQQADARPTAATEAAVGDALTRAERALAQAK
jgi:photosystem II stability/assembly factor-like uncharacterized protein